MENRVSDKIRRVLNEIAILNQPEEKNGKLFYRLEDLRQIKILGAELYLLSDLATKTGEVYHPEVVHGLEIPTAEPAAVIPEPEVIAQPVMPELTVEPTLAPEPVIIEVAEPVAEVHKIIEETPVIPEEIIVEEAKLHTHEPSEKLQEEHQHHKPAKSAEQLASGLSLTRRFEYINNLFGGNAELFMEFLDEVGYCRNTSEAMDVFDKHYEQNAWRKREEAADDLKRMIRKSFM
jgi:hypothetical protein